METFPGVLARFSRLHLGCYPTPLHRLSGLEAALDYRGIYIKRDDLSGLGPGGSKLRSLEYLLGEAVDGGKDSVIVSGPGQSNLCTLTAAACARLSLPCILVHNCAKPGRLTGNLLLNSIMGAESIFLGDIPAAERRVFEGKLAAELEEKGGKPYVIRNGGTTGMGSLGYAEIIDEIHRQCREEGFDIGTIFAPGGNGGVAAGLIYGNAVMGRPFRILVISVEDNREELTGHVRGAIAETERLTGIPFPGGIEDACDIDDAYRGEGWGVNTEESEEAVTGFPRKEGIFIEHVYTAKVVAGMEDYIRRGKIKGGVCYLHTGGFGSLFGQYEPASSKGGRGGTLKTP
ncbi:MAG: pyridoxal-phosphate dependent enzyme [Treponema sp.]|jgi:1-aminocyclopropane-1-carboxylate deaminase/D-cysteine desulfhydrase-like pyridoxal-dependent ACC family enzyme|nr:pyridoxal-phosphate dependent enzyme [Treponema sp.]